MVEDIRGWAASFTDGLDSLSDEERRGVLDGATLDRDNDLTLGLLVQ